MSSHDTHKSQAEHNEEMLRFMEDSAKQEHFSDWYVTVSFYAAVHFFEAMVAITKPLFLIDGRTVMVEDSNELRGYYGTNSGHISRNRLIKHRYKQLYSHFISLYNMSKAARYNGHAPDRYDWTLAKEYLGNVKREYETLIKKKK